MLQRLAQAALLLAVIVETSGLYSRIFRKYGSDSVTLDDQRLPRSVIPTEYQVKLWPDISREHFNGSVRIQVNCQEPTSVIVIHAHSSFSVSNVQVSEGNEVLPIVNVTRDATNDTLSITLENELQKDVMYNLAMDFNKGMGDYHYDGEYADGVFTSITKHLSNEEESKVVGAITEPKRARKVFPCFDEPAFKATFQISVARSTDMSSLSVMPLASTEIAGEDWVWDNFLPTQKLSTSAINFVVSNLKPKKSVNVSTVHGDILVRYHAREESSVIFDEENILPQMLEYLVNFLDIPFPLPEVNIVAMPNLRGRADRSSLGLIVLSEFKARGFTTDIIEYFTTHWTKHLITPQWWDERNVTTILAAYLVRSGIQKMGYSKSLYMLNTKELYETSGYGYFYFSGRDNYIAIPKAIWFLRMLNSTLTAETMKKGLRKFISSNMYGTYTEDKLWSALNEQAQTDGTLSESATIATIADSWLGKKFAHYPLVTVTRNYDDNTASLEQQIFVKIPHYTVRSYEEGLLWWVPIMYLTPDNADTNSVHPVAWMKGEKRTNISGLPDSQSFIILNPTDSGMFLVKYDLQNWRLITQNLISPARTIPSEACRKLLQDSIIFVSSKHLNYSTLFNMSLCLTGERDYFVWTPFTEWFSAYRELFKFTSIEDKLNTYIRRLMSPIAEILNSLDQENDDAFIFTDDARRILRNIGYQPYIDEDIGKINETVPTFPVNDNDTGLVLYCPLFMSDNSSIHLQQLEEILFSSVYMRRGLSKCPGYVQYIERILNSTIQNETVFTSSQWTLLMNFLTASEESYNMTFKFFKQNLDELKTRFYPMSDMWLELLRSVPGNARTEETLKELKEFHRQNKEKIGYSVYMTSVIIGAENEVEWRKENLQDIEYWFNEVEPNIKFPTTDVKK